MKIYQGIEGDLRMGENWDWIVRKMKLGGGGYIGKKFGRWGLRVEGAPTAN